MLEKICSANNVFGENLSLFCFLSPCIVSVSFVFYHLFDVLFCDNIHIINYDSSYLYKECLFQIKNNHFDILNLKILNFRENFVINNDSSIYFHHLKKFVEFNNSNNYDFFLSKMKSFNKNNYIELLKSIENGISLQEFLEKKNSIETLCIINKKINSIAMPIL